MPPTPLSPNPELDDTGSEGSSWPSAPFVNEASDARLAERARRGDEEAFAQLVARYERKLIRVLTRLVRDGETARDLAQDTFWRVYVRLDQFDSSRRFGPWLFRVAVNLGLDWLRKHSSNSPATLSLQAAASDETRRYLDPADPSQDRRRDELVQEVHRILELLPPADRVVLVLRDLEGFSSAEVAAILNRREATIRWRLAQARHHFRKLWERREIEPTAFVDRPSIPLERPAGIKGFPDLRDKVESSNSSPSNVPASSASVSTSPAPVDTPESQQ
ncbi:RNA polymerase, sigma-24 subunit, ECF subfamily [Isosphaera pallida ATCC 43644]|uniref:RNA polymerase, sigma-24 subunit, ECF subfamily n=1 Tax=Isosphaera pallida (strain ATCC 43644 / DSM 9630 / IS1B) TaxID=575540 RepID=E8QXD4_ISOPI|nr:sigma-70 family RNA polymerase sigma factor [Isosphaera pallida]ADV61975.1 RNA polymerase, sigma-24 subunit, ECF subfamily [Isosphaera pallida ATCC 43644]